MNVASVGGSNNGKAITWPAVAYQIKAAAEKMRLPSLLPLPNNHQVAYLYCPMSEPKDGGEEAKKEDE